MIVIGIDAHKRTHTLVAVDGSGKKLGEKTVEANSVGHEKALRWARERFGTDVVWGVEDNRSVTGLLERELLAAGQRVKRCPPHLMARSRALSRTPGKSDPIDAKAVALAVLREPDLPEAFHDPVSWELKLLTDRRDVLVSQRVAVINRLHARVHQIDPKIEPRALRQRTQRENLEAQLAVRSGLQVQLAQQELADVEYFSARIDSITGRIVAHIGELDSALLSIPGCAELTAAKLIAEAANVDRFRNEAAFARYVGIAPSPDWSGASKGRLRPTHSGNRQLNKAIHWIAVVQLRLDCPGREYYRRRRAQGDSGPAALRSQKRHICKVVFNRLRDDYQRRTGTTSSAALVV